MAVHLVPMTPGEFQAFYDWDLHEYARELVRADLWTEEPALERSLAELTRILPQGQATPNHFFQKIISDPAETRVGEVWYALQTYPVGKELFVYWLGIDEPHRRKGYATAALRSLEAIARQERVRRVALAVFGHNREARRLYDQLGFSPTMLFLVKPVESE